MSWLSDKLKEAEAQINPFDKGKTAATVRRDRAAAMPAQTVRSGSPSGNLLSRAYDTANVFDNNRTWNQRTPTNTKNLWQQAGQFGGQVARTLFNNSTKLVNTANLGARQIADTAKMQAASATNNAEAFRNAQQAAQNDYNRFSNRGGVLNTGTFFRSPEEAASGNFGTAAKRIGAGTVGAAVEVAPFARGSSFALKGKSFARSAPKLIAENTLYSGVGSVAGQLLNNDRVDLKQTAKDIGIGNALGFAGYGAGKALPVARDAALNAPQVARQANDRIFSTNPEVAQGGYARVPGNNPIGSPQTIGDIQNASNARPQADLQRQYEVAHNTGNTVEAERIAQQMGDPGLSGQMLSPEARQALIERTRNPRLLQDTPNTPTPQSTAPEKLPEYNTKKVSNLDKAFRSTRSIIERQGASGKQLADMLQGARDTQEIYLGQLQKQMPTLADIARGKNLQWTNKDFENFVDSTQGLAKPSSPRIAQAVAEWKATHPGIRNRAVGAGLDVGDLGENYYPHFIDYDRIFKDKNNYNAAINHLVDSGQAKSPEEAIQLLSYARDVSRNREFGNLEASRVVDLPFYDKTPNSLLSYLSGSTKRIAQAETFGAKDEKSLDLIKRIGEEGGDTEAAKNAYDIAVGARKYNPTSSKISKGIRQYVTTTRLGLGALTNVSQNVNTGVVTGVMNTAKAALKQLDPKTRSFVGDTGVIADAVLNDIRTQAGFSSFGEKLAGKVVNKITAPGFASVEKFNRSLAATAGRDYGLRLAQKGKDSTLRKLGVTGDIKNKTLTPEQQVQVARKVVEKTQFKVDAQDLPGWADSPGGKLVAQFRTFSYSQGKFVSNEILKPLARGNILPATRFLAALPIGYALYETKRKISGRPEEENKTKIGSQAVQNIGGLGIVMDIYQSLNPLGSKYLPPDRRTSMAVSAFGGPAVGVATQGIGAASEAIQRKNTPTDESRLEGKVVAGKNDDTYTDLTSASRFGLQQVPIVGTPIKNRLLPYKTESNADAGKTDNGKTSKNITDSIKQAKKDVKASQKDFASKFSSDDYALYKLGSAERKALVKDGTVAQEKFDQLDRYAKGLQKGMGKDIGKKNIAIKNDKRGSQLINDLGDMDKETRKKWESGDLDPKYKDIYDRASQIRFNGLPDLPKNNKVLSLYADFVQKRSKGSDGLSQNKDKLNFLKSAYKSALDKESQEIYSASSNDILSGLDNGLITPDQAKSAIAFDNMLVSTGLSSKAKISKTVRAALGLGGAPSKAGTSGRGRPRSGSKGKSGKRKGGKLSYKLYGFSSPIATNKSLRQLIKNASLSK